MSVVPSSSSKSSGCGSSSPVVATLPEWRFASGIWKLAVSWFPTAQPLPVVRLKRRQSGTPIRHRLRLIASGRAHAVQPPEVCESQSSLFEDLLVCRVVRMDHRQGAGYFACGFHSLVEMTGRFVGVGQPVQAAAHGQSRPEIAGIGRHRFAAQRQRALVVPHRFGIAMRTLQGESEIAQIEGEIHRSLGVFRLRRYARAVDLLRRAVVFDGAAKVAMLQEYRRQSLLAESYVASHRRVARLRARHLLVEFQCLLPLQGGGRPVL